MGDSEAPKRKLSRYTVRPGTLGSTLDILGIVALRNKVYSLLMFFSK
jgi:hypothetical protein